MLKVNRLAKDNSGAVKLPGKTIDGDDIKPSTTCDSSSAGKSEAGSAAEGGRKVTNPYGKKGGPSHRSVVESITPKSTGNLIDTEVKIDTTGGYKPYRYADAIEYNKEGKAIAYIKLERLIKMVQLFRGNQELLRI